MAAGGLTTLDHVKEWLGIANDASDSLLRRQIRAASVFALNYMQRSQLNVTQYKDTYDGSGGQFMLLRNYPVISVSAVSIAGSPVAAAGGDGMTTPYTNGWVLEDQSESSANQRLSLYGQIFPRGRGLVTVQYTAGYLIADEAYTVPNGGRITTDSTWLADEGVKDHNGVAMAKVTGTPITGQYAVDAFGQYLFATADVSQTVTISYSFVPDDIEQGVYEMVAERYKYRDRIGQTSKSLGGQETVSFSQKSMSEYVRELLNPYKRVIPV